jgi:hypothetical protein
MELEEAKTWRELLGVIIRDQRVKQRILDELGIQPITLTRWIEEGTEPRQQNFRQLLNVLPEYREYFVTLLGGEFTDSAIARADDASKDIPPEFFARVLLARANTQKSLRFWTLCNLILQQAIGQLDPDHLGMAITVVRCMKTAKSTKIRSLRETAALGTPPWPGNLEQKGMFLGAESLAGYCVTICRNVENNDIRDRSNPLPAHQVPHELSAAASPILFSGKIAGCILVSSTQPNFFLSQYRISLVQNYARLMSLAFEAEDFIEPSNIMLRMMPPIAKQEKYFHDFRDRVMSIMQRERITNPEAEQRVWEELESVLLELQQQGDLVAQDGLIAME